MKTYRVKPEYIDKWTNEAVDGLEVTEGEIERLAYEWGMPVNDLMAQVDIDAGYMAYAVELMDDDIREDIASEGCCENDAQFLREYERRHLEKFGEAFTCE